MLSQQLLELFTQTCYCFNKLVLIRNHNKHVYKSFTTFKNMIIILLAERHLKHTPWFTHNIMCKCEFKNQSSLQMSNHHFALSSIITVHCQQLSLCICLVVLSDQAEHLIPLKCYYIPVTARILYCLANYMIYSLAILPWSHPLLKSPFNINIQVN